MKKPDNIEAVFFDLDGTLLDTAPDLFTACNEILRRYGRPLVSFDDFRQWVHGGSLMMIGNSFQIKEDHPDIADIKQQFFDQYQKNITQQTQLFKGIEKVLSYLESDGIPWGIVTNKLTYLTEPLLDYFNLKSRCRCLVCGDTLTKVKPDPAPLLHACQLAHAQPEFSVYIGDSYSDIQAANRANMLSIAAHYGYLPKQCNPVEWQAHADAKKPEEIISILEKWLS
jgi:N-acetyl-D-muramate 6-phosphate phosphatase